MEEVKKRKTRMYDPWGYQEENNYQSTEIIIENDLDSFFADVSYNKDDNKIHFSNKDGEEVGTLDVSEFDKSEKIIEKAWYEDGKIYIKFTNGDLVTIDVEELVDENEFKGGLQVNEGVVSVLIDPTSETYLTTSDDGVKLSGIDDAIAVETNRAISAETALDEKIESEIARASDAETALQTAINNEVERAQNAETTLDEKIEAETTRASDAETALQTAINNEITRATQTEQALNSRIDLVNDELDSEESAREAADLQLVNRIAAEETRAKNAESALSNAISAEEERAMTKEAELDARIDEISSGSSELLDELIEKLGYKDNDTLVTTNEHEVAFGEYNISYTSEEASGQTIFSIGNGTSESERSNAVDVRKNGDVYLMIEGEMMNINLLLGQIAHEVYN